MARKSTARRARPTAGGRGPDAAQEAKQVFARGLALHQQGQLAAASACYQQALALDNRHFGATHLLGVVAHQEGRNEAAVELIGRALAINPQVETAYSNLGVALKKLGRFDEACASYGRAIELRPDYAEAHYNLGLTLQDMGRLHDALACYERAITIKPNYADAHNNRGLMLQRLDQLSQAVECYVRALQLRPDYYEALNNLGLACQEQGRLQDAVACYERAIALRPQMAEAYWNESLALLVQGDMARGWPLYERGLECGQRASVRSFTQPAWRGETSVQGKTVLLYAEQGLGDTLQFCRYAALVKALGARVVLEVQAPLVGVMAGLAGVDDVVVLGQPLPAFDVHCPLLSLPLAFHTTVDTVPHPGPYLQAEPARVHDWQLRLGPRTGLRVGLVWSGNPGHKNDHHRSVPLATLLAHLPQGPTYISLQKEVREEDLPALAASGMQHHGDLLKDFADTAALCMQVDVVVSVDTSVAHLAAALGRPTWVLLPFAPDWRWLLNRDDSPWYAGMRLFRQDAEGAWPPVLSRVAQALNAMTPQALPQADTSAQPAAQALVDPQTLFSQGIALHKAGRLDEAAALYQRTLALAPQHFDALHMLGVIAHQQGRNAEAVPLISQALAIRSDVASAHSNLGVALRKLGRYEEAVASYDRAIALNPGYAEAYCNRGLSLHQLRRFDEALASFDEAARLRPDYADAYLNKSFTLLLQGDFAQGWPLYEWRAHALPARGFTQPRWLGQAALAGKTVLLHAEQGLGDTLQFCRYAVMLKAQGARVVLEVPRPLVELMRGVAGVDELVEAGQPLPAFDFYCPLLSLPLALGTTLDTIPNPGPYLPVDAAKQQHWLTRLGPKTRPRVGLVWSSTSAFNNDETRSLALAQFAQCLPAQGYDYVCLQKELKPADRAVLAQRGDILFVGDELHDLTDTAALATCMDLVVSTCTSVPHLCAGLGVSTWMLLSYVPDFRWLLDRDDSPWYDSVRLFRQGADHAWDPVLARVHEALTQRQAVQSQFDQGLVCHKAGQLVQAQALYEAVLQTDPNHFDATHLLGVLAHQQGDQAWALQQVNRALQLNPRVASAHSSLGNILAAQGQAQAALDAYDRALALQPGYAEAWFNSGNALRTLNRLPEAVARYDEAIRLRPDLWVAYGNRGNALRGLDDWPGALASYERALELNPAYADAHFNRAGVLRQMRRFDESLAEYEAALHCKPEFPEALNGRGNTLVQMHRLDEALASYAQALALKPDYAEAHNNAGVAHMERNQVAPAIACFDRALAADPQHVDAHWNKSAACLLAGEYEAGWPLYEWRLRRPLMAATLRPFAQPQWQGESLRGKTLLIYAEQGYGDTVQFARYARLVKSRGARVLLEVPTGLMGLFKKLAGVDALIESGQPLPDFDFHTPLLSLPRVFNTTLDTIPSPGPYLKADVQLAKAWRQRLGRRKRPRVGLVWSSISNFARDVYRSMDFETLARHLPRDTYEWVCLQQVLKPEDAQSFAARGDVQFFGHELNGFEDTAALCAQMDVVVSVDTSVAHLAAALGKPTWVLLPFAPDWRWLLNREDSPWYDSVRLFRQDEDRQGSPVLARVMAQLPQVLGTV